jgi:4-oxalocrotonate tautomerase
MPTLNLKLSPPVDAARMQSLASALTTLTHEVLGKRREVTAVLIESLPVTQWFIGAEPAKKPTALLTIEVTAGTNTGEQKARFVVDAFAELQRQLGGQGGLETASYVQVRELPANDWGYGGVTQERRRTTAPAVPTPSVLA